MRKLKSYPQALKMVAIVSAFVIFVMLVFAFAQPSLAKWDLSCVVWTLREYPWALVMPTAIGLLIIMGVRVHRRIHNSRKLTARKLRRADRLLLTTLLVMGGVIGGFAGLLCRVQTDLPDEARPAVTTTVDHAAVPGLLDGEAYALLGSAGGHVDISTSESIDDGTISSMVWRIRPNHGLLGYFVGPVYGDGAVVELNGDGSHTVCRFQLPYGASNPSGDSLKKRINSLRFGARIDEDRVSAFCDEGVAMIRLPLNEQVKVSGYAGLVTATVPAGEAVFNGTTGQITFQDDDSGLVAPVVRHVRISVPAVSGGPAYLRSLTPAQLEQLDLAVSDEVARRAESHK